MLNRRTFLALLASVPFVPHREGMPEWSPSPIGSEEHSSLGDFNPVNAPLEPCGDLDMLAWRGHEPFVNLNAFGANEIAKRLMGPSERARPLASFLD